jgi:hypothetical protein
MIMNADATTRGRSLLDLLSLEYIFAQQKLLSVKDFTDACARRGLVLQRNLGHGEPM